MELTLLETEDKALALAVQCHKDQKDKADCNYIYPLVHIP
jgi:hypothetical protein